MHTTQKFTQAITAMLILLTLVLVSYIVLLPEKVAAQARITPGSTSGFFSSKVDYVSDMVLTCGPGEASIEFQLSDYDSKTVLSGTTGNWRVFVRDLDGNQISGQSLSSAVKVSDPICFNPNTMSLQVLVDKSPQYRKVESPAILPESDLSSMAGFHFRGYVHVKPETRLTNDFDARSLYPNSSFVTDEPNFIIQTNFLPTLYGATAINTIKFYVINADTYASESVSVPVVGGVGIRDFSSLPFELPDGRYFWTYHQDYNGSSYTAKPSSVYNWTFSPTPTTGAAETAAFTIDRQVPTITNESDVTVVRIVEDETVNVRIGATAFDLTSGVANVRLYLLNAALNPIGTVSVTPEITTRIPYEIDFFQDLTAGSVYNFYTVVTDAAGNVATSTVVNFRVPALPELEEPVLQSWPPESITSNAAGIRSDIIDTGNSIVTVRGTCWALSEADVYTATGTENCSVSTSSSGFGTGIFSTPYSNLPADSAVYYRGFAQNSAGIGYSPISSFTTQPSAFATSTSPIPPAVRVGEATDIIADAATLSGRIIEIGGDLVSSWAICWAVSAASLPTQPSGYGSSCFSWSGGLPAGATLPYIFSHRFEGLPYNSNLVFRVLATNAYGTAYSDGAFRTAANYNDFIPMNVDYTSIVDRDAKTYDLDVALYARDASNYTFSGRSRSINYEVRLKELNGTVLRTEGGVVPVARTYVADTVVEQLYDIPYGAKIVEIVINTNPILHIEPTTPVDRRANNTFSWIVPFSDPDAITGIITGGAGGTGPSLPDPGFELSLPNAVIRSGEQTVVNWDTKVNYPMDCQIFGPNTFAQNGIFEFDPSVDGVTGSVSTGPLTSAQTFEISCTEPVTNSTFSTTTRVEVTGKIQES